MKLLFSLSLILFFTGCLAPVNNDNDNQNTLRELTADEQQLVQANRDFSFQLFREVSSADPDNNIFISPLSVSMALGMTLNGAAGSTFDDMRTTLGFGSMTNDAINKAYRSLLDLLSSADKKVLFEIANSIWYEKTFSVEQAFIEANQTYFDAEVAALDFTDPASVDIINNWISNKTHEKIQKALDSLDPQTVMALVNAIYFKAVWKYEFDPEDTRDDVFITADNQQVDCKMMRISGKFNYFSNDDVKIIELAYGNSNFNMTILQPSAGTDINNFISNLDKSRWDAYKASMQADSGSLQMPKFKLNYKSKTEALLLNDMLATMGMEVAFNPGMADFSRINPNAALFISKVLHKTFIQVDEEGTEAAAVTIVQIKNTSAGPDNTFFMRLDRPFVFVINEKNTEAIMFVGKIMKPVWED